MSNYRPQYANRHGGRRDRRDVHDSRDRRDNQRPPPQSHSQQYSHPPPPGTDSWRKRSFDGPDYSRRSPPRLSDRYNPQRDAFDDRRGHDSRNGQQSQFQPPRSDFSFRMERPPGISDSGMADSYRPGQYEPRPRSDGPDGRGYYGRGRGRGRGRGGYPRIIPAERELLQTNRAHVREDLCADGDGGVRYRDIDNLTDDEDAAMEISDASDEGSGGPARKKARQTLDPSQDGDSAPKWSNPDAETALPPADEAQKRKKSMVKLIRKARLDDKTADKLAASTDAEDFISFDLDDGDANLVVTTGNIMPPHDAPASGRQFEANPRSAATEPKSKEDHFPQHEGPGTDRQRHNERSFHHNNSTTNVAQPDAPPSAARANPEYARSQHSDALGSRKRTIDDEIKPPNYAMSNRKSVKMPVRGNIVAAWEPIPSEDPCPWVVGDHAKDSELAVWLHKEVVDFYEHVRPRKFEQRMRSDLVDRLQAALQKNHKYKGGEVHPFGSFMSGLYLPTADMDIVICSRDWLRGGATQFPSANSLHKFKTFLCHNQLAELSTTSVVPRAKVPLVKYIDKSTGLRVDISFDRKDGPAAIGTFLAWKKQYPALPILVTIVKHFLVMRGLNEPVNGGIGSFSVSCMVMNILQQLPSIQSGTMVPEHHLGELLIEFFDFYGSSFDYKNIAIRINPPGYVKKADRDQHKLAYKNKNRLSIIDPNNSSNDIAGGSSNIAVILEDFRRASQLLRSEMSRIRQAASEGKPPPRSILECILAGNYSTFRQQRDHLRVLHEKYIGPCED